MLAALQTVLLVLASVAFVVSVLSAVRLPYWWTRAFDFPRLQIFGTALVVLVAYVALNWATGDMAAFEWVVAGLLALVLVYQTAWIVQYSPLAPVESKRAEGVPRGRRLRLLHTNVLMENRDFAAWHAVIGAEDFDVLVAVETDQWWAERMRVLEAEYPHKKEVPQDDTYGMVVYSRFALEDLEVKRLVEAEVPSIWARVRLPAGPRLQLVLVHPRPPRPDIGQDAHLRDAELVLVARAVEPMARPVVIAGDFNDVAWSYTTALFQRLAGLLDPRRGRGLYTTYHADHRLLRYPLDHVFHSDDLALAEMRVLGHVGSDHFPIFVDLAYVGEVPEQDAPGAGEDDREHGEDLVEFAREKKAEEGPGEERERKEQDV